MRVSGLNILKKDQVEYSDRVLVELRLFAK